MIDCEWLQKLKEKREEGKLALFKRFKGARLIPQTYCSVNQLKRVLYYYLLIYSWSQNEYCKFIRKKVVKINKGVVKERRSIFFVSAIHHQHQGFQNLIICFYTAQSLIWPSREVTSARKEDKKQQYIRGKKNLKYHIHFN